MTLEALCLCRWSSPRYELVDFGLNAEWSGGNYKPHDPLRVKLERTFGTLTARDHDVPHTGQIYWITLCTAHTQTHTRDCYGVFLTDMSHFNKIQAGIWCNMSVFCFFFFLIVGIFQRWPAVCCFVSWSRFQLVLGRVLGACIRKRLGAALFGFTEKNISDLLITGVRKLVDSWVS